VRLLEKEVDEMRWDAEKAGQERQQHVDYLLYQQRKEIEEEHQARDFELLQSQLKQQKVCLNPG
jgi:hypothetical protein